MKRSYFLYTNGTLKRKDNTITFINEQDEKRDIPIEMIDDFYVMSEMSFNTNLLTIYLNLVFLFIFLTTILFIQEVFILEK